MNTFLTDTNNLQNIEKLDGMQNSLLLLFYCLNLSCAFRHSCIAGTRIGMQSKPVVSYRDKLSPHPLLISKMSQKEWQSIRWGPLAIDKQGMREEA